MNHQKQIVVIHNTTPKWWRNLQSDVKIRILNKGYGWHDLYANEVKAIRAASQLLHLPHRLNEWLDAAPQGSKHIKAIQQALFFRACIDACQIQHSQRPPEPKRASNCR